jgi:hypothetical protein
MRGSPKWGCNSGFWFDKGAITSDITLYQISQKIMEQATLTACTSGEMPARLTPPEEHC